MIGIEAIENKFDKNIPLEIKAPSPPDSFLIIATFAATGIPVESTITPRRRWSSMKILPTPRKSSGNTIRLMHTKIIALCELCPKVVIMSVFIICSLMAVAEIDTTGIPARGYSKVLVLDVASDATLSEALQGADGVILDGAVRTRAQAERAVSPEIGLDTVVELAVPREELIRRVLERGREQDNGFC